MHQKSKKKVEVSCKKYIGLSVRTKRSLSALQKALQKHCNNIVRVGVMNKLIPLSHNGSYNGNIIIPKYKRDLKERYRFGRFRTNKRCTAKNLQSFLVL